MQTNQSVYRGFSTSTYQCARSMPARRDLFHPPSSILHPLSSIRLIRRSAFTLVELLVVITIIAVLMTLTISVVGAFITQARDAATKTTLNKIQGLVNSRAQALIRLTMRKGYVTTTDSVKKVIGMKNVERKYFPQQVAELSATDQSAMYQTYSNQFSLTDLTLYNSSTMDVNYHQLRNSEILYNFLTQANVLGDSPITTDAFTSVEVVDTPEILDTTTKQLVGNGLPEFVDAWGQPLRFYRWPTRFFRSGGQNTANGFLNPITTPANAALGIAGTKPNADGSYDTTNASLLFSALPVFSGNLASDLNRDPDDPLRICQTVILGNGSTANFEQFYHTPATYHMLLVVSAGPDGQLGIFEPDDFLNFGHLAQPIPGQRDTLTDNIMYLNVRAGGK